MIQHQNTRFTAACVSLLGVLLTGQSAIALELDWSGQFRAEYNYINNYSADNTSAADSYDPIRGAAGGYYIPAGGSSDASFQTVFLKLRPKVVVNDNIYIKSELWLGDPVYGIFGNAVPGTTDQLQFYSNQSRGSFVSAQRLWGEFLSDIGTVQVGRAPLNWGLGVVWHNGDGLWDRYHSTGDTIRLVSKFGAFSVSPSFVLYSAGNNIGGALPTLSTSPTLAGVVNGDGGVREYSLALKYENLDDELEGGLNFIKRLAGAAQDTSVGYRSPNGAVSSFNYNIWDIYAKKRLGRFTFAAEVPITTGNLGTGTDTGMSYSTFAVAAEIGLKLTDSWEFQLKGGHAPGQPNWTGTANPSDFKAFFFNPAYRLGLIMFNYQLASFAGPNTVNNPAATNLLRSPYDNPIVNANYLLFSPSFRTEKWTFGAKFIYAHAHNTAGAGQQFYNARDRRVGATAAASDQAASLGFETDLSAAFQWDEYFQFRLDTGVYLPGAFYKFANRADAENLTSPVFAVSAGVGVNF
jgi:hypothetical protein